MEQVERDRFLRPDDVFARVGFQDTTIRKLEKLGQFPQAILIGSGKVKRRVWRESEIIAWMYKHARREAA